MAVVQTYLSLGLVLGIRLS